MVGDHGFGSYDDRATKRQIKAMSNERFAKIVTEAMEELGKETTKPPKVITSSDKLIHKELSRSIYLTLIARGEDKYKKPCELVEAASVLAETFIEEMEKNYEHQ